MTAILVQAAASRRLDEIYRFTRTQWGEAQADRYIQELFDSFSEIPTHAKLSRPIPAEFGVSGCFYCFRKHIVYWKRLRDGNIGIVTILHERMHQIERFGEDFTT
ncbi:MAG: type II toxin-antitoxin system RelE/ParE family toxin [Wenzhouxiangella sp.]|nr:MAG: type II toxin-antitoxin system RelE/ParE family toxin [Wenzhouxiangella sp.]